MSAMWYVIERFAEISTIGLSIYFLYRVMDVKITRKKQIIAISIFIFIRVIYYSLNFSFRPYFAVFILVIYASYVFAGNYKQYVVWSVFAVVLDGIIDVAAIGIYFLFPNTSIELANTPGIDRTIIIIVEKVILLLSYYLISRSVDKSNVIRTWDCVLMLLIPIGCWVLLEVFLKFSHELPKENSQQMFAVVSFALLLIITSVVILYNKITADGKELTRSKLQLQLSNITQEHIIQIKSLHTQLSSIRHDLHNHFFAIRGYINVKDYDALNEYFNNLVNIETDIIDYGSHPVINVLISSRKFVATENNIEFKSNLIFPDKLPVNDVDLCILVGNILDNAFEASKTAYEPRFINLSTRIINSYWAISCRNSIREKGNFRAFGNINSTKDDSDMHGIGTKQISAIAEKTGGFVTYKHNGNEFVTLVMLKIFDL